MNWKPGVYTALVTPFGHDGDLDLGSFRNLLGEQIRGEVSGVILWGSTGEGLLLSLQEKLALLETTLKVFSSIVHPPQLILNVGGSSTAEMVQLCTQLKSYTYDGMMVVIPPYIKPPLEGIIQHVNALRVFDKPIMLYHIPARTGRSLSQAEMQQLLQSCPHITSLKEASGDLEMLRYLSGITHTLSQSVSFYIGDDPLYLPALKSECAVGVVSVISNAIPAAWQNLTLQDDKMFQTLCDIFKLICGVPNPVGIKYALAQLGVIELDVCRLPLVRYLECKTAHTQVPPDVLQEVVQRLNAFR